MNEGTTTIFGIRVRLREDDPFSNLVGDDWDACHWFENRYERDRALRDMSREHEYSRKGDKPSLIFEPIDGQATS